MLLDERKEMRKPSGIRDDHGFPEERAAFRTADIEGVAKTGKVRERKIIFRTGERIGKARAVEEKRDPVPAAHAADPGQFLFGIERTELGRLRNVNKARHDHMVAVLIVKVSSQSGPERFRRKLPVFVRDREDLVAVRLDRACFMDADVPGIRRDDALIGQQERVDHRRVGLRAADEKIDRRILCAHGPADLFLRRFRVPVRAVSGRFFGICLHKTFQHLRVRAFHVITCKGQFLLFHKPVPVSFRPLICSRQGNP